MQAVADTGLLKALLDRNDPFIFENAAVIFTLDHKDFLIYRKCGNQPISCVFPPTI